MPEAISRQIQCCDSTVEFCRSRGETRKPMNWAKGLSFGPSNLHPQDLNTQPLQKKGLTNQKKTWIHSCFHGEQLKPWCHFSTSPPSPPFWALKSRPQGPLAPRPLSCGRRCKCFETSQRLGDSKASRTDNRKSQTRLGCLKIGGAAYFRKKNVSSLWCPFKSHNGHSPSKDTPICQDGLQLKRMATQCQLIQIGAPS